MAGANIIYGIASTDSGSTTSFTQAVLDAEMISGLRRMLQGIEVHDLAEEMAMIKRLTPRGNFLAEKHTREHFKVNWMPQLFSRDRYTAWQAEGRSLAQVVRAQARRLLAEHKPPPLAEAAEAAVRKILAEDGRIP